MSDKIVAIVLLAIIPVTLQAVSDTCTILIGPDRKAPQPLVLSPSPTGLTFLYPDTPKNNYIEIGKLQGIILACPGKDNYIKFDTEKKFQLREIRAMCRGNKNFEAVQSTKYNSFSFNIDDVVCKIQPQSTKIHSSRCFENGMSINLGYQIEDEFLSTINVCFNNINYETYYAHHKLRKESSYRLPPHVNRNFYWREGNYHPFEVTKLYNAANRGQKYSWSKGHLAPVADFLHDNEKSTTFCYLNSAPQLESFNTGNWKTLEENIRNFAVKNELDLEIYTGVYGQVKTIVNGIAKPLYLSTAGGLQTIPVPLYFWKIIYDPKRKLGTAFVGYNFPDVSNENAEIYICGDIANKIPWLTWEADNVKYGISYACSISDIREAIASIPNVVVRDILI